MKILYVTTISNTINAFLIPHIELLISQGHQVDIACNIDKDINEDLIKKGCNIFDIEFQRSPFTRENWTALKKIKKLIKTRKYDIVHTHTPVASTCVRLACKNIKNVKIIYTAHGFHFFRGAPLRNWLIYFPIEKYLARYTDVLITINKEDYKIAKKSLNAKNIEYIPGVGIDIQKFNSVILNKPLIRKEIELPEEAFVILSVGELNKNKNHETIIKALEKINNPNIYYIICGHGKLENYLKKLAEKLSVDKNIRFLGYRNDIAQICAISDIFAFPSKREGLGLAAIEAMASGLPLVTSNVHGILDYSINGKTGYNCGSEDVDGFVFSIKELMANNVTRKEMGLSNIEIAKRFDVENIKNKISKLYNEVI